MRSKNANKICDYFESLNIGDKAFMNDIVDYVGNNNNSRCRQDIEKHLIPVADGILKIGKDGRKKFYEVVGDAKELRKNADKAEGDSNAKKELKNVAKKAVAKKVVVKPEKKIAQVSEPKPAIDPVEEESAEKEWDEFEELFKKEQKEEVGA